ncbi:radical SAM protein, partial [Candidatus Poribacteria bacterium]|nr:radical SAM protein [Candidatus Poribacteria bacterium]
AEMAPVLTATVVYGHNPSASTQLMPSAGATCTAIKQNSPDLKVLLVGGHVTALPERTLREENADFVCGGEGLHTLVELLQALKSDHPDEYGNVSDLWYWDGGAIRVNHPAPLVRALDQEMPEMAWDLLPMEKYRAHNWHCFDGLQRQPYAALYTTLGCPYHCTFCLLEGTVVITARGRNRKIEDLKIGDKLMAWDERGECLAETEIIATGRRLVQKILRVKVSSGQEIYVTHEHPVLTPMGWVEAGELKPGDSVLLMDRDDHKIMTVKSNCPHYEKVAEIEELEGEFKVYNFQCSPHDNYFAEFMCVHNCCIQAPFKSGEKTLGYKESVNSYRFWSPGSISAQIDKLVNEYGVRNIKIADEMFVLNPRHVLGICDLIIERGYDLNIWAYARVDTVKDGMIDKLKRAGFNWLAFGIEAASERVRDDVQKGFDQDDIFQTLNKVRGAGINVGANYIFGLPEDDLETMQQTLDLALELNSEYANFYCFVPGTLVHTVHGISPIENVWGGQDILGWCGTTKVVDHLKRYYEGTVYEVKPRYLPSVTVTPEHPILIAELQRNRSNKAEVKGIYWKRAKDIVCFDNENPRIPYDAVIIPKTIFKREGTYVDFSPFVKGHVGGGYAGGQLNETGKRFLAPWKVTEDLAELFGWYVAEGYRVSKINNQIGFALCADEKENIERVRELVYKCFGYKTQVLSKGENCVMVTLTSKVLYRALPALFGEDSHSKNVPEFIVNATAEVTKAFLKGYIAGDGTSHPNEVGQFNVVSCSDPLARQVMMLFMKVGIVPSYGKVKVPEREIGGRTTKSTTAYHLSWIENPEYEHFLEDDENFYLPIRSIKEKEYQGMVYNLTTQDETYAMPFIVHNCTMAYPGSQLYNLALKERWPLPEKWSGYSQHSVDTLPLPTKYLSASEVLRFRDHAFQVYFNSPKYLDMITRKFGPETAQHIREMASHQLVRQYA